VVAFAADDDLSDTVSVQKFYYDATKGGNGEHIYTIDEDEISWYKSLPSWNDEGEAWKAPLFSEDPVYRVANYNTGEHLWITDKGYVDYLVGLGWTQEQGVAFYSDENEGVPVYRLWNGTDGVGSHHFTTNEEEIAWLVSTGWTNEGPQFYGVKEEEPGELEIVDLEATGSKELTATLNKEAEIDEDDVIVKKGNVTLTPADVTVVGDEVVITLGSKIVKGTYSVTIEDSTKSVETEDEKLVEFATVGVNIAQITNDEAKNLGVAAAGLDDDDTTVNASIDYQALNQYGETISTDVLQVSNTFGGKTFFTSPTAKKDGTIVIYNVPAALGIQGTEGNLIVVDKTGVSTTCPVTMSEAAKVRFVTPIGIMNADTQELVESIPAEKTVLGTYALLVDVRDQYGRPMYAKGLDGQAFSVAQMLSNVNIMNAAGDSKFHTTTAAANIADVEVGETTLTAIALGTSDDNYGTQVPGKAKAGSVRLMAIGDRFGTVLDTTIDVEQIDLVASFNFSAKDTIYNGSENELDYTATSVDGEEITDYKTLSQLVKFTTTTDGEKLGWRKNQDGSASLIYVPNQEFNDAQNLKENTVASVTATCDADISPADTIVVPKTFTVYEDKQAYSVVKYTGPSAVAAGSGAAIQIAQKYLVVEDQYGNTLDHSDKAFTQATFDYQYGDNAAVKDATLTALLEETFDVTPQATKLYLSVAGMSRTGGDFDKNKAQTTLSFKSVDPYKVTNLKAEWNPLANIHTTPGANDGPAMMQKVTVGAVDSGVDEDNFKVTGTVGGATIVLDPSQYSIKIDTYTPITEAEKETAVKTALVTMTVLLTDEEGEFYTEEVSAGYMYSAAAPTVAGILSANTLLEMTPYYLPNSYGSTYAPAILRTFFRVFDQYGDSVASSMAGELFAPSYEVNLGDVNGWTVSKNDTTDCTIQGVNVDANKKNDFSVTATLENGMSATCSIVVVPAAP